MAFFCSDLLATLVSSLPAWKLSMGGDCKSHPLPNSVLIRCITIDKLAPSETIFIFEERDNIHFLPAIWILHIYYYVITKGCFPCHRNMKESYKMRSIIFTIIQIEKQARKSKITGPGSHSYKIDKLTLKPHLSPGQPLLLSWICMGWVLRMPASQQPLKLSTILFARNQAQCFEKPLRPSLWCELSFNFRVY